MPDGVTVEDFVQAKSWENAGILIITDERPLFKKPKWPDIYVYQGHDPTDYDSEEVDSESGDTDTDSLCTVHGWSDEEEYDEHDEHEQGEEDEDGTLLA